MKTINFNAHRQHGKNFFEAFVDTLTDFDNVDPGDNGNGNADGWLSVVAHHGRRRFQIPAFHGGNIPDSNQFRRAFGRHRLVRIRRQS